MRRISRAVRYLAWFGIGLFTHPRLLVAMWCFAQSLPERMKSPLPELVNALTPRAPDLLIPSASVKKFADAVAALDIRSPLDLCLRRSLVRFDFLRRAGLNVVILFGARFRDPPQHVLGGHAWLILNNQPYEEERENYTGFAVMYRYPQPDQIQGEVNDLPINSRSIA